MLDNKKGQVTVFIIVALLVVAGVGLFFILRDNLSSRESVFSEDALKVKNYVDSCLSQTLEEGIYFVGLQGGYYNMPENFVELEGYSVPLHLYNGKMNFPDKNKIEKELDTYVEDNLDYCINLTNFEEEGISVVETGEITADSSFSGKKVYVKMGYPLSVRRGDSISLLDEFESSMSFDFDYVSEVVNQLAEAQEKSPDYFPLGAFSDLAYSYNFSYETIYLPGDVVVYSIAFDNLENSEGTYYFSLGAQYDW